MKTNAQFCGVRKGALDLSLYPAAVRRRRDRRANIGLMPALVTRYEQGARGRTPKSARR